MRFLLVIVGNILALFLSATYIEGFTLQGGLWGIVIVGLVFSVINILVKPVVKLLLGPLILLTFGLLIIVINMGMLWVTDLLLPQLSITSAGALFLATILIGLVNFVVHVVIKK